MAEFIDFKRIEIGPETLTARVVIGPDAPLYTSEDLEGTTRVYRLMPDIINHVCLGDKGGTFKEVMGDTELAHLLEHVAVELLAQTNRAGDITSGRTKAVEGEEDTYDIELGCPDDVLVVGALSSAAWILQWAYTDGADPEPDVQAIVDGLVQLVDALPQPSEPVEYEDADEQDAPGTDIPDFILAAAERGAAGDSRREAGEDPAGAAAKEEPEPEPEGEEPARDEEPAAASGVEPQDDEDVAAEDDGPAPEEEPEAGAEPEQPEAEEAPEADADAEGDDAAPEEADADAAEEALGEGDEAETGEGEHVPGPEPVR